MAQTTELTVYLLKSGREKRFFARRAPTNVVPLGSVGNLYFDRAKQNEPKWAQLFQEFVPPSDFGRASSPGALLVAEAAGRSFAITFGTGRFLLDTEACEERFGLRVALNTVSAEELRSIDKNTLDSIGRHTQEQASRGASAADFGFDVERDLLRAVTGPPEDATLGKRVSGFNRLSLRIEIQIHGLPKLLESLTTYYRDDSYKERFGWVDHLRDIGDKGKIEELDAALVDRIKQLDREGIWLAVPEVLRWHQVGGFRYGRKRRDPEYPDIHLNQFLETVEIDRLDAEVLRNKKVECFDVDGREIERWSIYKCLSAEIDLDDGTFVLSNGLWYRIARNFVEQVNETYAAIPDIESALPVYKDDSEDHYLKRIAKEHADRFSLMHTKLIPVEGVRSRIEFCDLYGKARDMIHVKRYGSSRVLGHLFSQGVNAGQLFLTDAGFRAKVNEELGDGFRLSDPTKRPPAQRYRVVFAVVSDRPGKLAVPFFARLSLRNAYKLLVGTCGYRIAKTKIETDVSRAALKKYPSAVPKR